MLRDSAVVVRTRPRAIPLTMITMGKSPHGFPFVSHIWVAYWAPLVKSSKSMLIKTGYLNFLHFCDFLCFNVMNQLMSLRSPHHLLS